MNREQAVRTGFYQALESNLSYGGNPLNVYDQLTEGDENENLYVLLTDQNASVVGDFTKFRWECNQIIQIVHKQIGSVSKDVVDDISQQIENLIIYPTGKPGGNGLVQQDGWKFENVVLSEVESFNIATEKTTIGVMKVLRFTCTATKY